MFLWFPAGAFVAGALLCTAVPIVVAVVVTVVLRLF